MRWIAELAPDFPHVPELPARGPWAHMLGRAAAVLVDLPLEVDGERWRTAQRRGRDAARAASMLREDLDAVEDVLNGYRGEAKLQLCGPLTLAASVEYRSTPALADDGATAEFAGSLREGLQEHLADVRRRVPHARWWVQIDEPAVTSVVKGDVPTASGLHRVPAMRPARAVELLAEVASAASDAGAPVVVHTCSDSPPLGVLTAVGADALSLDTALVGAADLEMLAAWIEQKHLFVGLPLDEPEAVDDGSKRLHEFAVRLGVSTERCATGFVITPRCGLASAKPEVARDAYAAARRVAERLANVSEGAGG